MSSQFDATAHISVDLRGFRSASQQVLRSGGDMERVFRDLHNTLNRVDIVEKNLASDISRTARVYAQVANTARTYATAVQKLDQNSKSAARGAQLMSAAFEHLRSALSAVRGMSEKDAARLQRTLSLYEQMTRVLNQLATAQQRMAAITQNAQRIDQAAARDKARAAEAAQRLAMTHQRLAYATNQSYNANTRYSTSTYALRSSIGELEQGYQQLRNILIAIPKALANAAISQESAFAQVTRVVGEADAASAGLLKAFQGIAQTSPISFEEVAKIGQLGAQIGIGADHLEKFTDTITRFSLTTGVASEEATLLLGRIAEMQHVPISQMENLGSAILALGTASAATDAEILRVNESIATVSNLFGLSVQAVSGLSSALATVKVRPELARGSLTRVFGELRDAAEQGGTQLKQLSAIMNMTSNETVKLFRTNPKDEFFLQFVKGLNDVVKSGGSVRTALGGLGIEAVRDIDAISRLANNYDMLSDSFTLSYTEFAKGTELQRQSKGIYETTANELQNLADAFKNLLAQLGTPLAQSLGDWASFFTDYLLDPFKQFLDILGPVIPILTSVGAAAIAGVAAWAAYQVVLSKVTQSFIAMRELQRNLGVTTIGMNTALQAYRGNLGVTTATTMAAANATRSLQVSVSGLATSLQATGAASAATIAANRNIAITSAQAATANQLMATQMAGQLALVRGAAVGLNTATAVTGPALTTMSAAMQRAVASGTALGSGMQYAGVRSAQAAVGINAAAGAATRMGLAARVSSLAFGPWGLAIAGVGLLLAPLISGMFDFSSSADKVYASAMEASGGTQALTNAIKADTQAAEQGVKPLREIAVSKRDVSAADRQAARSARDAAQARINEITLVAGSVSELKRQAQGHDAGAQAARRYLNEIKKENQTLKDSNAVLGKNTAAIGAQTRNWLMSTAEAAANASGLSKSEEALKKLGETGLNVGDVLTKGLTKPEDAIRRLNRASGDLQKESDFIWEGINSGGPGPNPALERQLGSISKAKNFIDALKKAIREQGDEAAKNATVEQLLGKALDKMGGSAGSVGGKVKLTSENLEDLEVSAEDAQKSINTLASKFEGFGTPLDAFKTAAEGAFGSAKDAIDSFSLSTKGGLDSYLKELDKIAKAQRDWATNLIKISATLGPDIAAQFQELGPQAAPAVEELANLGVSELAKIKPKLAAIGNESVSELAASIIKGSSKIKNASASTASIIANIFGKSAGRSKTSLQFDKVVSDYQALLSTLSKSKAKINISIDDAKAFKSLNDIRTYVNLVNRTKISPKVAIDLIKARGDLDKIAAIIREAEASGKLDAKGKANLQTFLYDQALIALQNKLKGYDAQGLLDPKGKARLSTADYNAKIQALVKLVGAKTLSGLLDPKGRAKLDTKAYYSAIDSLAKLVLSTEQQGKLNPKGSAKLNKREFEALLKALKDAVADANRGKLNPKGSASLDTDSFHRSLGGIVLAANRTGSKIQAALSRTATVSVVYRNANNPPPQRVTYAARGGWIRGPGGPRDDRVPVMGSNKEFMVNARSAKQHADLLEAINSPRGMRQPVAVLNPKAAVAYGRALESVSRVRQHSRLIGAITPDGTLKRRYGRQDVRTGPVINVNNTYPQAEPTSITINRSLAYAAALSGTLP